MYQMRQGGMQRDSSRDYRQFAGGQPQGMQFPSQGPSMTQAPSPQATPQQGMPMQQQIPMMQPGQQAIQQGQGQMLARALQMMPRRMA